MVPLTGYADRFSAAPGDTIAFKVSSVGDDPFAARLVRIRCGDPNPEGPGNQGRGPVVPVRRHVSVAGPACALGVLCHGAGRPRIATARRLYGDRHHLADHAGQRPTGDRHQMGRRIGGRIRPLYRRRRGRFAARRRRRQPGQRTGAQALARASLVSRLGQLRPGHRYGRGGAEPLAPAYAFDDAGQAAATVDQPPGLDTSGPLTIAALGGSPVTGHFNGRSSCRC